MNLPLEDSEVADLREALQSYTQRLRTELARADQRRYRAMLREKLDRYERLCARLDSERPRQPPVEVIHFH
jgi:hypothetical protein